MEMIFPRIDTSLINSVLRKKFQRGKNLKELYSAQFQ